MTRAQIGHRMVDTSARYGHYRIMRLAKYLDENSLSYGDFGLLVGATSWGVGKWARGERTPRPDVMRRIQAATDGAVTPDDLIAGTTAAQEAVS